MFVRQLAFSRRSEVREPFPAQIELRKPGTGRQAVTGRDLSTTGCCLEMFEPTLRHDILWVTLPGLETLEATVRWVDEGLAGIEFKRPLHPAVLAMLLARVEQQGRGGRS